MPQIKVSVIIPVFNVENYLGECLDSIINQSLSELEIICINDGSTDNSLNILHDYQKKDNRIRIINQENHGQGYARNVGLSQVVGDYVYFMDADDYLELTALEELYNLAENKSLDLIIFKLINFHDENRETFQTHYYDMVFLRDKVGDSVFNYNDVGDRVFQIAVSPPGKLFKRSLIENIRFPENLIFEDNPFFVEAFFNAKRVYFYDKYLYYRRVRNDSTTSNFNRYSDSIIVLNKINDIIKDLNLFNQFSNLLYFRKIDQVLFRYNLLDEEYKPNFFVKMKEDFISNKKDYESDAVFRNIEPRLKNVFYSCISSNSYKEFELHLAIFEWNNKIESLKQSNKDLMGRFSVFESRCQKLKIENEAISRKISNLGS